MLFVSQGLFAISAGIALMLGTLHLVFAFRGERFHTRDSALLIRMKEVLPFTTRQTTIWRANQGLNASHTFNALLTSAG